MKETPRHKPSRRSARPQEAVTDLPAGISKRISLLVESVIKELCTPGAKIKNIRKIMHEAVDEELLIAALHQFNANQSSAAKFLGMPRRTLVYLAGQHGLRKKDARVK